MTSPPTARPAGPADVDAAVPEHRLSSPLLLVTSAVVVLVLLATTCVAGVLAARTRDDTVAVIATRIGPLNAGTATVYRALADADAAAISEDVGAGSLAQQRYDSDIGDAAAGLAQAAAEADDPVTTDRVTWLSTRLPIYTALVEQSRTGSASGLPPGTSYLESAAPLVRNSMLPVAASLQQQQARRLGDAFDDARSVPVVALIAGVGTLLALVIAQVLVARRVRRVLNPGLAGATLLLVAGLVWWTVAGVTAGGQLNAALGSGRALSQALVPAQITALRVRAAEGENLVTRTPDAEAQTVADRMELLDRQDGEGGALGAAARLTSDPATRVLISAAVADATAYQQAYQRVDRAIASARPDEAASLAVGSRTDGSGVAFERLDDDLVRAVASEQALFGARIDDAQQSRVGLVWGTISLAVVAAMIAAGGLWSRLDDYQNPARRLREFPRGVTRRGGGSS